MRLTRRHVLAGAAVAVWTTGVRAADRLKIGITLHPYYSFVSGIVGDLADVMPLIPPEANPHGYQPQSDDMKRAMEMDVLVVNGIGHDEWAFEIIQAAGRADMPLIEANASVALNPTTGEQDGTLVVNPHTFVATTAAIQQVYEISRGLGEVDPDNAAEYGRNARAYAARIRALRAEFMTQLSSPQIRQVKFATMHAGYDYLFQELGLTISAVIEPRHGVSPTARQLARTIDEIKSSGISVLFSEKYFAGPLAGTIEEETGVKVYPLSHITDGPYTEEKFEVEMRENLQTIVTALTEASG